MTERKKITQKSGFFKFLIRESPTYSSSSMKQQRKKRKRVQNSRNHNHPFSRFRNVWQNKNNHHKLPHDFDNQKTVMKNMIEGEKTKELIIFSPLHENLNPIFFLIVWDEVRTLQTSMSYTGKFVFRWNILLVVYMNWWITESVDEIEFFVL